MRDLLKRMSFPMKKHYLPGSGPTMVLDFLAQFVKESDVQEVCKAHEFIILPAFLEDQVLN